MAKYYTGAKIDENGKAIERPSFFEKVKKLMKERFFIFVAAMFLTLGYMLYFDIKSEEAISTGFTHIIYISVLFFFAESVFETAWHEFVEWVVGRL